VRDLALGLDRSLFAVQVAMPEDGGNVSREDFSTAGIPFHCLDIASGFSLRALQQMRSLAASAGILHVHGARAALFGRLAAMSLLQQRPLVLYTIHGFAAPHYPPPRRQVLLSVERCLMHSTDLWVCVSHAERDSLLATGLADAARTKVIWNGIHVELFRGVKGQRHATRRALDISADAFVVTTVCRLYRPRDFPTLLHAFRELLETVPQAHLLIVGDGPLRAQVEQDMTSLALQHRVRLLGMRPDVPQILGATDVFVLSSRGWEGLPLAILEAMASSLPVVASDVGGTREAVIDGQTGFLYAPGDPTALVQRLRALGSDAALAQRMGQRGLARVEECFTVQRMVNETAALYEALAHQRETSSVGSHT
jgi:glycosyltransferase involved in cell wall biosynthesis